MEDVGIVPHYPKEISLVDCLFNVIRNEQNIAIVYANYCERNDLIAFTNSVLKQIPKNKETLEMRWAIRTILAYIGADNVDDMSKDFVFDDFKAKTPDIAKQILPYITIQKKITDKLAHDLGFYLVLLEERSPGIFHSMVPHIQELISLLKIERIFQTVGYRSFGFLIAAPPGFIENIREFEYKHEELKSLFHYPINYNDVSFSLRLQNRLMLPFQFPSAFPVEFGEFFTLTNNTVEQKSHFLDIMHRVLLDALVNLDLDAICVQVQYIPELIPYMIVAMQPIIYGDLETYVDFLRDISTSVGGNSLVWHTIDRFCGDIDVIRLLSGLTGNMLCANELSVCSIPVHVAGMWDEYDAILHLSEIHCFTISDADMATDMDFVRAYTIFRLIFGCWDKPQRMNENLQKISSLLAGFHKSVTRQLVLIDMFCLVFLKRGNKFICSPVLAQRLVSILVQFDVPDYIHGAALLFEKKKPSRGDLSLDGWFTRSNSEIYRAIETRNWTVAEDLVRYLPQYRRLYNKAYAIYLDVCEGQKSDDPIIKLEIGLSTFGAVGYLKSSLKFFVQYAQIIKQRIKQSGDTMLSALSEQEKWEPCMVFVSAVESMDAIFELLARECRQKAPMLLTIRESKRLSRFIEYMSVFVECAHLSDAVHAGSIEDILGCGIIKALSGAFNTNQYDLCDQLAEMIGIELLPYVIRHIQDFRISGEYLDRIADDHPIESAALSVTHKIPMSRANGILRKAVARNDPPDETVTVDLLLTDDSIDIDDHLFRVDHTLVYDQLMKHSPEKIAKDVRLFEIFSVVSYAGPVSNQSLHESVLLWHEIFAITSELSPTKIVTDLIKSGKRELCLSYIRRCLDPDMIGAPLCQLVSLSVSDLEAIDAIMCEFRDRYDLIAARFIHVPGILMCLLKYAPPEKYEYFRALSLLPETIFTDSNVFEISTIVEAYQRHQSDILSINAYVSVLFNDTQLLEMLKSIRNDSPIFQKAFLNLWCLFDDKNIIIDFWLTETISRIRPIIINSVVSESAVLAFFCSIRTVLSLLVPTDKRAQRLKCIESVILEHPFSIRGIIVHFNEIETECFGEYLFGILQQLDAGDSIITYVADTYNIDLSEYHMNVLIHQLNLCPFSDVKKRLSATQLKIDQCYRAPYYDTTFPILNPIVRLPVFDKADIKKIDHYLRDNNPEPKLDHYRRLQKLCRLSEVPMNQKITNDLKWILTHCVTPASAISLFVSFRFYDEAYQVLMAIQDPNERADIFVQNFVFSAALISDIDKLHREILRLDRELLQTRPLWDALAAFFRERNMNYGLFTVYTVQNQLEDAALMAVELFKASDSLNLRLNRIGLAISNITQALECRLHGTLLTPPFISCKSETIHSIEKLRDLVELQFKILEMCMIVGIEFTSDFDLLSNRNNAAVNIAALLMVHGDGIGGVTISMIESCVPIDHQLVSKRVCEMVSRDTPQAIMRFIATAEKSEATFQFVKREVIKAVVMSDNRAFAMALIHRVAKDQRELCALFLEYNYVLEAYSCAVNSKLWDLLPVIGFKASELGNIEIVTNCTTFLEYYC